MRIKLKWRNEMSQLLPMRPILCYEVRLSYQSTVDTIFQWNFIIEAMQTPMPQHVQMKCSAGIAKTIYTRVQSHWNFRPVNIVISRSACDYYKFPIFVFYFFLFYSNILKWVKIHVVIVLKWLIYLFNICLFFSLFH